MVLQTWDGNSWRGFLDLEGSINHLLSFRKGSYIVTFCTVKTGVCLLFRRIKKLSATELIVIVVPVLHPSSTQLTDEEMWVSQSTAERTRCHVSVSSISVVKRLTQNLISDTKDKSVQFILTQKIIYLLSNVWSSYENIFEAVWSWMG